MCHCHKTFVCPALQVQCQALLAIGNLCFCPDNRRLLLLQPGFKDDLIGLASGASVLQGGLKAELVAEVPTVFSFRKAAARVLAILGTAVVKCRRS